MKSFLHPRPVLFRTFSCAALLVAGLAVMAPASANGSVEPLTILSEPGSAGLGFITRVEPSPYREGGNRYDVLPLYL
ncbi:MAG: MipA/OmpV family protein, partial [Polaromonas sp.]